MLTLNPNFDITVILKRKALLMIICENDLLKDAAEFYATKLGIPDEFIIAIGHYPEMDTAGYCEYHDDDIIPYCMIGVEIPPEEGRQDPLEILAHEMVHAKQYALGELVDLTDRCRWLGIEYPEYEPGSEEYYFSPWELEAFGKQVGLFEMYCRLNGEVDELHGTTDQTHH